MNSKMSIPNRTGKAPLRHDAGNLPLAARRDRNPQPSQSHRGRSSSPQKSRFPKKQERKASQTGFQRAVVWPDRPRDSTSTEYQFPCWLSMAPEPLRHAKHRCWPQGLVLVPSWFLRRFARDLSNVWMPDEPPGPGQPPRLALCDHPTAAIQERIPRSFPIF